MCACASVGEGDRKRKAECTCVCVLQFARACLRFVSVRAGGSLTLSTLQPVHVCLSTLRMHHGAPAHTHTHTEHVLVFVCLFAGRGQHTSETQGDMRDHHTLQRHCWLQKMEDGW